MSLENVKSVLAKNEKGSPVLVQYDTKTGASLVMNNDGNRGYLFNARDMKSGDGALVLMTDREKTGAMAEQFKAYVDMSAQSKEVGDRHLDFLEQKAELIHLETQKADFEALPENLVESIRENYIAQMVDLEKTIDDLEIVDNTAAYNPKSERATRAAVENEVNRDGFTSKKEARDAFVRESEADLVHEEPLSGLGAVSFDKGADYLAEAKAEKAEAEVKSNYQPTPEDFIDPGEQLQSFENVSSMPNNAEEFKRASLDEHVQEEGLEGPAMVTQDIDYVAAMSVVDDGLGDPEPPVLIDVVQNVGVVPTPPFTPEAHNDHEQEEDLSLVMDR